MGESLPPTNICTMNSYLDSYVASLISPLHFFNALIFYDHLAFKVRDHDETERRFYGLGWLAMGCLIHSVVYVAEECSMVLIFSLLV